MITSPHNKALFINGFSVGTAPATTGTYRYPNEETR
jgi:hypothetical protein